MVKSLRCTFLCLVLFQSMQIYSQSDQANSSCPTQGLSDEEVTPEKLEEFVNRHRLTLDQTICCLPESWRRNYAIASTSQSAQRSAPHAPRIILSPPASGGKKLDGRVVTFQIDQSGQHTSEQRNSIEMMDLSGPNNKPRFSDLKFNVGDNTDNSAARLRANNSLCLNCHSEKSNPNETFPVFSFAPIWQNTFPKFYKPTACPTTSEEADMKHEKRNLVQAVSQQNNAYQCLPGLKETIQSSVILTKKDVAEWWQDFESVTTNPRAGDDLEFGNSKNRDSDLYGDDSFSDELRAAKLVETFESKMVNIFNLGFVQKLKNLSMFSKYKYAIAGALLNCFDASQFELKKWFNERELTAASSKLQKMKEILIRSPLLSREVNKSEIIEAMTCLSGQKQNLYQTMCFPTGCLSAQKAATAIEATLHSSASKTDSLHELFGQSIAQSNLDYGRNWLRLTKNATISRYDNADAWGAFKFIIAMSCEDFNSSQQWASHFVSDKIHRNIFELGLTLMNSDTNLKDLKRKSWSLTCQNLAATSLVEVK